jgi:hypothetical protein
MDVSETRVYFRRDDLRAIALPWVVWTALTFLSGLALLSASGCSGCDRGYSDGERTGVVLKFSRKGLTYKSWEGRLDLGGASVNGDGQVVRNFWDFSVVDPAVVPKVQAAMRDGRRVTLHYQQWLNGPITIDTDYEVDDVKEVR